MSEKIIIDPLSRISGFLEIQAVVENNRVINANALGLLYRGFENMLIGRPPLDAIYFTERICGICSMAHSVASAMAIENALNIEVMPNDYYIREILHGLEYVQNHLRHFYLMMVPSFVQITSLPLVSMQQYTDFRLSDSDQEIVQAHYIGGIEFSRMSHEAQAVFGGKAPHNHGVFAGGTSSVLTAYNIEKVKALVKKMLDFVSTAMREDTDIIASYYPEYYEMGVGYGNFMSYGMFDHDEPEINYVRPGVLVDGVVYPFDPEQITEQTGHSWYKEHVTPDEVDLTKADAYTFIKTPRYQGMPMEVGPLARMLLSGDYHGGGSCMDRIVARTLETEKVLQIISQLLERIKPLSSNQQRFAMPDHARGSGLIDTTRGALAHYITIDKQVIGSYNLITPSMWNLSPEDNEGNPGVIEKALIGTVLKDSANPVELGRIVRSFDPCVSCATHVYDETGKRALIRLLV